MSSAGDLIDFEPCSYCGTQIPADIVRCPKCGNYTDGQGPMGRGLRWTPRRIAVTAIAILTLLAFLATMFGGC